MQTMGAAWLMVQLSASPHMVALVQTALTLPIFLLVVLGGKLADQIDRRTYLLFAHGFMALIALGLSLLVSLKIMTPELLLCGLFLLGCGMAMRMPAWQATMSSLVESDEIHSAASLNGMSFNFARAVGPALTGILAQYLAISLVFWLTFLFMLVMVLAFWRWRSPSAQNRAGLEQPYKSPSQVGFSPIFQTKRFHALLIQTFFLFLSFSCLWSLLPAFTAIYLHMTALSSGFLLGCLGAGAVAGGVCLPPLKAKMGINHCLCLAALLLGVVLVFIGLNTGRILLWLAVLGAGWSWALIASSLNGTVQGLFPVAYRARGISIYLMVMYGGTTFGSWIWGYLSLYRGMRASFFAASAVALFACGLILKRTLHTQNAGV